MAEPHLRIRSSGYGGSGYYNPFTKEKVIGVTTALDVIDKPGVRQWIADQTAAYAVANVDLLLDRDEERGYAMLRWYHNRLSQRKLDDPDAGLDLENYHTGVLNDLADLGTWIHEHAEAYITGTIGPEPYLPQHEEMAAVFEEWWDALEVRNVHAEVTVFGSDYGGTGDLRLQIKIDGEWVWIAVDFKSSRAVYDAHVAQLAAYGAADTFAREVSPETEGAVEYKGKWFVPEPLPPVQKYAVLQIRPTDWDDYGNEIPPFVKLHMIPQAKIDAGFEMFKGAIQTRKGQAKYAQIERKEKADAKWREEWML